MESDNGLNRDEGFGPKTHEINGKILLGATGVLFMAVLFFLGVNIYSRCMWQRSLGTARWRSGSSRRRRLAFVGNADPARVHRVGLEKSAIGTLPVFVYRAENRKEDPLECAVCLCEFEENEKVRLLPKCKHSFHIDCIDMWFGSNSTCPLCRTPVQPDPPPSEVDASAVTVLVVGESSGTASEGQVLAVSVAVDGNREADPCRSENRVSLRSSSHSVEGTPRRSMERIVVDIPPRRPDSFSSPRGDQQLFSPGGQSSLKSPASRLHSLRRILSRASPQSPGGSVQMIEQGIQSL